jgi:hypothetical protein
MSIVARQRLRIAFLDEHPDRALAGFGDPYVDPARPRGRLGAQSRRAAQVGAQGAVHDSAIVLLSGARSTA